MGAAFATEEEEAEADLMEARFLHQQQQQQQREQQAEEERERLASDTELEGGWGKEQFAEAPRVPWQEVLAHAHRRKYSVYQLCYTVCAVARPFCCCLLRCLGVLQVLVRSLVAPLWPSFFLFFLVMESLGSPGTWSSCV